MKKFLSLLLAGVMALTMMTGCQQETNTPAETPAAPAESTDFPQLNDKPAKETEVAVIETEAGTIKMCFYPEYAPKAVENFLTHAKDGYYDGLTFHRIIEGFMMQGGDPLGNGYGDSGQSIKGEFVNNGVPNTLSHTRGAISMARSAKYDSASCQFFIVHQDATEHLDGDYACFGYVTEGMDIVDKICAEATPMDSNGLIMVEQRPRIQTIKVEPIQ